MLNVDFIGPSNYNVNELYDYINQNNLKEIFIVTNAFCFYLHRHVRTCLSVRVNQNLKSIPNK